MAKRGRGREGREGKREPGRRRRQSWKLPVFVLDPAEVGVYDEVVLLPRHDCRDRTEDGC